MTELLQKLDGGILLFIQEHVRCGALTVIMKAASWIGNPPVICAIVALLFIFAKTRRLALDMGLGLACATAVNNLVIKNLVARPRPFLTIEALETVIEPLSSFSFPSGHSCAAFAAAFVIWRSFRDRGGGWAWPCAALVALSRIYVGVHYPSDILVGAAVGVLLSRGAFTLSRRFIKGDLITKWEKSRMA